MTDNLYNILLVVYGYLKLWVITIKSNRLNKIDIKFKQFDMVT